MNHAQATAGGLDRDDLQRDRVCVRPQEHHAVTMLRIIVGWVQGTPAVLHDVTDPFPADPVPSRRGTKVDPHFMLMIVSDITPRVKAAASRCDGRRRHSPAVAQIARKGG
jgi:hypothetical protein